MNRPCGALQPAIVNGVDVTALLQIAQAIKLDARLAKFNFRLANTWLGGDRNRSAVQDFTGAGAEQRTNKSFVCESGEPEVLLGRDGAPNPVEWLQHALAACITTTIVYHAAARGIAIDSIESRLDGEIDLRGFLGLDDSVRPGYSALRVRLRAKTKAGADTIKSLLRFSPMYDMVSRATALDVAVETY
jgi:uncharacterized OsmC-like protein